MIITANLRKIAVFLIYAAEMDIDDIEYFFESLLKISNNPLNFDTQADVMTLNPKGLEQLKRDTKIPVSIKKNTPVNDILDKFLEILDLAVKNEKNNESGLAAMKILLVEKGPYLKDRNFLKGKYLKAIKPFQDLLNRLVRIPFTSFKT